MTQPDDDTALYVGAWNHAGDPSPTGEDGPGTEYRGTPIWRRVVALVGLSTFAVLGGIIIFLTIAALIALAAIVLQLVIS